MNNKIHNKPVFNRKDGFLLSGIHLINIPDLYKHPVLASSETRIKLINSLKEACGVYWSYGIEEIFVDGSFASMKENPNDIDGYIAFENENSSKFIQLLKSGSIWGDFLSTDKKTGKYRMWAEHRIEFYAHPIQKAYGYIPFPVFYTGMTKYVNKGILKIIR